MRVLRAVLVPSSYQENDARRKPKIPANNQSFDSIVARPETWG